MPVAQKIRNSIESSSWIRKMFEEGIKLKAQFGEDKVFDFSLGNPDLAPPAAFREVMSGIIERNEPNQHGYMPNAGYPFVREAIARKAGAEQGVELGVRNIIMTVGAAGGLNVLFKALLNPGSEVIVSRPYFVEYGAYVDNHGGKLVLVDPKPDFGPDVEAIGAALNENTAAVLINSPNNPSGRVYRRDELDALAAVLEEYRQRTGRVVLLVADEPYREIVYDGIDVPPVLACYPHSVVITSYSKTLSLPGERIGYIAVNPACDEAELLTDGMILANRILGFVNAPALMQRAVAALTSEKVDVELYRRRRDLLCAALDGAGLEYVRPDGAFYIFCKTPDADDIAFVQYLKQYNILAVPGSGFGMKGYCRFCYCVPDKVITNSTPVFARAMTDWRASR